VYSVNIKKIPRAKLSSALNSFPPLYMYVYVYMWYLIIALKA